ncbi:MAG: phage portal protein [Oscillospiraceae bacterium]
MINKDSLKRLGIEPAVSAEMQTATALWADLFLNKSPWLDEATKSLALPSSICGELARLTTVELSAKVAGGARGDYLGNQLAPVLERLRVQTEKALACGGIVLKPYPNGKNISVDFVSAQNFIPTGFNGNGDVTSAAFVEQLQKGKVYYTRIEQHINGREYTISNKAYYSTVKGNLGVETALASVSEWANLEPAINIKLQNGAALDSMLFAYFKMPFANTVDTSSPLGVSVYAQAVSLIEQADKQYSRTIWEYEGSELAVHTGVGATLMVDGKQKLPARQKRLFSNLSLDSKDGEDFYNVFSPAIRDESLFNGLNELLRRIEFLCYLSYGTLSNPQSVEKTAEEIKMSKQRSYSAVRDIQKSLENALNKLLYAMDTYASLYRLTPSGAYQAAFNWGDGIMTDTDKDREQMRQDCRDGAAEWWEYRVKFYGETEEEAKKHIDNKESLDFER